MVWVSIRLSYADRPPRVLSMCCKRLMAVSLLHSVRTRVVGQFSGRVGKISRKDVSARIVMLCADTSPRFMSEPGKGVKSICHSEVRARVLGQVFEKSRENPMESVNTQCIRGNGSDLLMGAVDVERECRDEFE